MITVDEALKILSNHTHPSPCETVPLGDSHGRILRESVRANRLIPPFDRVTMDGYAIHSDSFKNGQREWTIQSTQYAGEPPHALEKNGQAIEVMTGCELPGGADTVMPYEDSQYEQEQHTFRLRAEAAPEQGQHIHFAGSDAKPDETLLSSGIRLRSCDLALCASVGVSRIEVAKLPKVAFIATGDEMQTTENSSSGKPTIALSNDQAITGVLSAEQIRLEQNLLIRDDEETLETSIKESLQATDVLLLTGGVSRGKRDYIPGILKNLGCAIHFHRVLQKPGGPMLFATLPQTQKTVFALPGNPMSCLTCMHVYFKKWLAAHTGRNPIPGCDRMISLGHAIAQHPEKTRFVPVQCKDPQTENGERMAEEVPMNTSGDVVQVVRSDGYVRIPAGDESLPVGTPVEYNQWQ